MPGDAFIVGIVCQPTTEKFAPTSDSHRRVSLHTVLPNPVSRPPRVEEYSRGSAENPMSYAELRAKFDENASGILSAEQRDALADEIDKLERLPDTSTIVQLAIS